MDARLQRRIQRYGWDLAEGYEAGWRTQLRPAHQLLLEGAALVPGERVLDVACGTGLVGIPAARAVAPGGAVLGVDLSGRMVERALAQARRAGVTGFAARRMDAEHLALDDASFDVVLHALGLMYVPDPRAALRETCRVLRPGGRTAIAVWGASRDCGWAPIFPIVQRYVTSEVCPLFFQLGTADRLAGELTGAGFVSVTTRRIPVVLRYESGAAAAQAVLEGGPVALAYSRFDAATRARIRDEYLAAIADHRDGDGCAIPGAFLVATARRR